MGIRDAFDDDNVFILSISKLQQLTACRVL